MDTLESSSVTSRDGKVQEPSAETAQNATAERQQIRGASPLVPSPEARQLAYELRRKTERQASVGKFTVEISRVDQDLDANHYLEFLRVVSNSAETQAALDKLAGAAHHWAGDEDGEHEHNEAHDSGQPQDGLSREYHEPSTSRFGAGSLPEYVALLCHKPRTKTVAADAEMLNKTKDENARRQKGAGNNNNGDDSEVESTEEDDGSATNARVPEKVRKRTLSGMLRQIVTLLVVVGLPAFLLLHRECREPMWQTATFAWQQISPLFQTISSRDLFLHDDLMLIDALSVSELQYYERPTPDHTDRNGVIKARFEAATRAVIEMIESKQKPYVPDMEPGAGAVEEDAEDAELSKLAVDEESVSATPRGAVESDEMVVETSITEPETTTTHVSSYEQVAARPQAIDTAALLARVKRLEGLLEKRDAGLAATYEDMRTDRHPIVDTLHKLGLKQLMAHRLFPATDPQCRWSFLTERCEPACACSWQYKIGDLWPSRSCRLRPTGPICDEEVPHEGPIRRTFTSMGDRTKRILRKVNSWIPKMPQPILRAYRRRST